MISRTDSPYADFLRHEAERNKGLICINCEEHIQDEFLYLINDKYICETCINDFRHFTEDYMEG